MGGATRLCGFMYDKYHCNLYACAGVIYLLISYIMASYGQRCCREYKDKKMHGVHSFIGDIKKNYFIL